MYLCADAVPPSPAFSGGSYEAALRACSGVHRLDLDDETMGHAVFAVLDCEMDRSNSFSGLLVSGAV
jgi:hypothetical protein